MYQKNRCQCCDVVLNNGTKMVIFEENTVLAVNLETSENFTRIRVNVVMWFPKMVQK